MSDRTGTQVDRYQLLRFLGSDNFADVYLAFVKTRIVRLVAIVLSYNKLKMSGYSNYNQAAFWDMMAPKSCFLVPSWM